MASRDIDGALAESWTAFEEWRRIPIAERARTLRAVAQRLRDRVDDYAFLITQEMGKPITEARGEIEKCAWNCDFYAEHGASFLAAEATESTATTSYVQFSPLGPVLAIMPWNFPFWQVFRAAAPILIGGNVLVLKHASNVTGCALAMEELFAEVGAGPRGLLRTVVVRGSEMAPLIADTRIRAVTLTGSEAAGAQVAAAAGAALKKTVLELGGSDAFLVLPDADLDAAVETAVRARFQNAGQSCIAAKRFIIVEDVADEFETRFAQAVSELRVGDPLDPLTQVGPLARDDLRDDLEAQLARTLDAGARLLVGGDRPQGKGYFLKPGVVTGVTPDMTLFREESFGPIAPIVRVAELDKAIALANDSEYGLSSNVWTADVAHAVQFAGQIEAGGVFINGMTASDPRLPFGGVKRSGYGRELGRYGLLEFQNVQAVWIGPPGAAGPPVSPSD
jgi:succinate-semialdehyde dehydrogenase/glutarate-semialdehyde dehydrogenase